MFFAKLRTTFTKKKTQADKSPKTDTPRSKKSSWFSWLQFKRKKNLFSDGTERVNQGAKESRRFSSYFATTPKLEGLDLNPDAATLKKQRYRKSAPVFPSVQNIADLGSGLITTPQDLVPQSSCVVVYNDQGEPVTSDHLLPNGEYSATRHPDSYKDPYLLRKTSLKQRAAEIQFKGPLLRVSESQRFDKTGRTSLSLQGTALSVSSALARRTSSRNSLARSRSIRSTASRIINLSGSLDTPTGAVPAANRSLSSITPTSIENSVTQVSIFQETPIRGQVSRCGQFSKTKAAFDNEAGEAKATPLSVSVSHRPSVVFVGEGNHTTPALPSVSTTPTTETQSITPVDLSHHDKEVSSGEATTTTGGDTEGEHGTEIPRELATKAESVSSSQSGRTDPDPTAEPISPYILPSRILLNRKHSLQNRGYCSPIGIQKRRNTVTGGRTEVYPIESVNHQESVVPLMSRRDSLPHLSKLPNKADPTSTGGKPREPQSLASSATSSDNDSNSQLMTSKRRRRRTVQLTWPVAVSPWGTFVAPSRSILVPMKSSIYPRGSLLPTTTRRRSDYSWVCEKFADQLQDPLSTASWVLSASREMHVSPLQCAEQQGGSVDTELYSQSSHLGDTSSADDVAAAQHLPLESDRRKGTSHSVEAHIPELPKDGDEAAVGNSPLDLKDSLGPLDLSHAKPRKSSRIQLASLPNLPVAGGCRHRSRNFSGPGKEPVPSRRHRHLTTGQAAKCTDNQRETPIVLHHSVPYFVCIYDYDPRQTCRHDGLRYRPNSLRHCRSRRPIRTQSLRKLRDRRPISLIHRKSRSVLKRGDENPHLLFIAHHQCVPDTRDRPSLRPTGSVLRPQRNSAKSQAQLQIPRRVANRSSTDSDSSHDHSEKVRERVALHRVSKSLENLVLKSTKKDQSTPSTQHARRHKRHTVEIPSYNFKVRSIHKPGNVSHSYGDSKRVMTGTVSEEASSDDVPVNGLTHTLSPAQSTPMVTM